VRALLDHLAKWGEAYAAEQLLFTLEERFLEGFVSGKLAGRTAGRRRVAVGSGIEREAV
jgi:hypothetical protein